MSPRLTLRSHAKRGVSKGGQPARLLPTLRDATLRVAPQGEVLAQWAPDPEARELLGKCDAVLRIGGPSTGADDMVATGQRLGKRIFRDLSEIPERRR